MRATICLLLLTLSLSAPARAFDEGNATVAPTSMPTGNDTDALAGNSTLQLEARIRRGAATPPPLSRVRMPDPKFPKAVKLTVEGNRKYGGTMKSIGSAQSRFWTRMSRGKVRVRSKIAKIGGGGRIGPRNKILRYVPGADSVVPFVGNAVSARHEMGHEFGLQHANVRSWKTQTSVGDVQNEHDPFDPLTIYPDAASLNAPHLHYLKWFTEWEEAYAQDGGEFDLRVINDGKDNRQDLKALYYPVPGTDDRRYWFSYVKIRPGVNSPLPGMPGTALAIHTADDLGTTTYLEGLLGVGDAGETHVRTGLQFELSNPTPTRVHVKVTLDRRWKLEGN